MEASKRAIARRATRSLEEEEKRVADFLVDEEQDDFIAPWRFLVKADMDMMDADGRPGDDWRGGVATEKQE